VALNAQHEPHCRGKADKRKVAHEDHRLVMSFLTIEGLEAQRRRNQGWRMMTAISQLHAPHLPLVLDRGNGALRLPVDGVVVGGAVGLPQAGLVRATTTASAG
jgi:hypothetical protein